MSSKPKRQPLLSRVPADFVRAVLKGHSALGLAFAAAIYLVCLTGSIAVFAHEFQRWELAGQPRLSALSPDATQRGLENVIAKAGGGVEHGFIHLPSPELPYALVTIEQDHVMQSWIVGAAGEVVGPGDTAWTEFLTRLHINLHLPQTWGVFLVGLTGVALLSSLISGLLAHPRVFRDAFHLRIGGSRRLQEADLHNRLGVWALPFHVLLSLSGAVLGLTTIVVGVLGLALFQGDVNKVYALFIPVPPKDDPRPAPVIDLKPMFAQVERIAPGGRTDLILLEHPTEMGGAAWFNVEHDDGNLANVDAYAFRRDGTLYHGTRAADGNVGTKILGSLGKLHFGWFGGGLVKIAYALLGLALTYVTASGVTIWLARRRDKRRPAPGLERLWTAAIWGQPAALALAALLAAAFGPAIGKTPLVAAWGLSSLAILVASARIASEAMAAALLRANGALLIAAAVLHAVLRSSSDPIAWSVDATLLCIGGGVLWLSLRRRAAAPGERDAVPA